MVASVDDVASNLIYCISRQCFGRTSNPCEAAYATGVRPGCIQRRPGACVTKCYVRWQSNENAQRQTMGNRWILKKAIVEMKIKVGNATSQVACHRMPSTATQRSRSAGAVTTRADSADQFPVARAPLTFAARGALGPPNATCSGKGVDLKHTLHAQLFVYVGSYVL